MSAKPNCPKCGAPYYDEVGFKCGSIQSCDVDKIPDDGSEPAWEFDQSQTCQINVLEQRVAHLEQICQSAHDFLSTMRVPQTRAEAGLQILAGEPVLKQLACVVAERESRK